MNILYGIAFLTLIYYLIQWKNITYNLKSKLINQHSRINNKIQKYVFSNSSLIEGFKSNNGEVMKTDIKQNNCNTMFLPSTFKGNYNNEIVDGLFNYATMKKNIINN